MTTLDGRVLAWDVLMFFAILLLVLALVPPLFSRRVTRRKTWHSLLLSLLVFSIGEILLLGHQQNLNFNGNLCLVQVALIYSTPPLVAVATAAYSSDIYVSIRRMFESDDWEDSPDPHSVVLMVLAPWITFFLVFLEAILVVGLSNPSTWEPTKPGFYCHTVHNTPAVAVSAAVVIIASLIAILLQAVTGRTLYKNWIQVQNVSIASTARKYFHAFMRTISFTAISITGIILGLIATSTIDQTLVGFSLLLPFFPITAALVFGTYKDILSFYVFWK